MAPQSDPRRLYRGYYVNKSVSTHDKLKFLLPRNFDITNILCFLFYELIVLFLLIFINYSFY
jgi:hypothetical protein